MNIDGKVCDNVAMDIVMLAAGTSSRMGKTNKLLLPYRGVPMVAHSCMQALLFLEKYSSERDENCTLIVVTGYRHRSVEKVLEDCRAFIGRTQSRLGMVVVRNPEYRCGQFSSTKTGVEQVASGSPFFISLADMPLVTPEHYCALVPLLQGHDAVRPFYEREEDRIPGHPVLLGHELAEEILRHPDGFTVSRVLGKADVLEPRFRDPSWALDIDMEEDYRSLT